MQRNALKQHRSVTWFDVFLVLVIIVFAWLLDALTRPAHAQTPTPSPDFSALDYPSSQSGKTLQTAAGTWTFGPNTSSAGGNEILLNGSNANGGNARIIQVGNSGQMFALALDNSWWVYAPATNTWSTSPGTPYMLSCTPPTFYLNGASINLQLTFTFYRGVSPKDLTTEVTTSPTCSHTYYGLTGNQYFMVTAKDPSGNESPLSGQLMMGTLSTAPAAPSNLVVKGNTQVFAVKQTKDHLATTNPVGTIPIGTLCDPTQRVNDMFIVPRDSVTWYGNVQPQAVVAPCNVP